MLLALEKLPLRSYERPQYSSKILEARRRIASRDPEDVDLLALSLRLDIPIWSNDADLQTAGVKCYTTAKLLKMLLNSSA